MGKPNGEYLIFVLTDQRPDPAFGVVKPSCEFGVCVAVYQLCLEDFSVRFIVDIFINHTLNIAVGIVRHFTFILPVPLQTLHCL